MDTNKQKKFFTILGFCLIMVCLFPVLKSGLYSDDLHNFQLKNNPTVRQQSIIDLSRPLIDFWKSSGRYTPISAILTELVFRCFNTLETYKLFVFIMNLLAIAVFLLYLSSLNLGINTPIWLLCFGAVIQLRVTFHDAFSSINGMYQVLSVLLFLSLLFYCMFLKRQKNKFLILSVFLFATALLLSEVGMTVLILMPVSALILKTPRKLFFKSYLPALLIAAIYLGYVGWLRVYKFNPAFSYQGLEMRLDLQSMWTLLKKQLYASLPLSNLDGQYKIPRILSFQLANPVNLFAIIAIIIIAVIILHGFHRNKPIYDSRLFFSILLFSLVMMITPAIFILPSVKYQNQVFWGSAYLPVYLQNFGSATLLACLFQ